MYYIKMCILLSISLKFDPDKKLCLFNFAVKYLENGPSNIWIVFSSVRIIKRYINIYSLLYIA